MTTRVLFPFSGHIVGGSHISTLTLITHLPKDIQPIIGVFREGPLSQYLDERNIQWHLLPALDIATHPLSLAQEMWQTIRVSYPLRRFLRKQRIDIVHTQEYNMHCLWMVAKLGSHVKHIWHQRSLNDSRRLAIYEPFVDYYLTISQFCHDHLVASVRERAEIIYNPIHIPEDEFLVQGSLDTYSNGSKKIGFIGHLDRQKRVLNFIEIAHRLRKQNTPAQFFIFGNEKTEAAKEARQLIEKYKLGDDCVLMGARFPISPWIRELDLLVAPAAGEGLGRSLIEAQILGVPVLASEDGGHKELIRNGETGYFAPLDDIDAFVTRIIAFLEKPDQLNQITMKAKQEALAKFGVESHVKRIVDIYKLLKP